MVYLLNLVMIMQVQLCVNKELAEYALLLVCLVLLGYLSFAAIFEYLSKVIHECVPF
jgi:hypothetical protein